MVRAVLTARNTSATLVDYGTTEFEPELMDGGTMRLGLDASNLRMGGGITHLAELLRHCEPEVHQLERVLVWGGRATLDQLPSGVPHVELIHDRDLDGSLLRCKNWQQRQLARLAASVRSDLLFNPGGGYCGGFKPYVTMSRNLLPFEGREMRRYGPSLMLLKMLLLRWSQTRSIREADGVIFLNEYARSCVFRTAKRMRGRVAVIPHGVDRRFFLPPRKQLSAAEYGSERPLRWIYVSTIDCYKHTWNVAEAVAQLRRKRWPITLDMYGSANPTALRRLETTLTRVDPLGRHIVYRGAVRYSDLPSIYHQADAFVYASSCENMPNILLEAMAAGLPIACSQRGPMPEMLGSGGVYFDPEQPADIANAMEKLLCCDKLRARNATTAYELAQAHSWKRCAGATFAFLARIVADGRH